MKENALITAQVITHLNIKKRKRKEYSTFKHTI